MTDKSMTQSLDALIERLEKLEGPDREVDWLINNAFGNGPPLSEAYKHLAFGFTRALDAALPFAEKMLPGVSIDMMSTVLEDGKRRYAFSTRGFDNFEDSKSTPALALILATLRALRKEKR